MLENINKSESNFLLSFNPVIIIFYKIDPANPIVHSEEILSVKSSCFLRVNLFAAVLFLQSSILTERKK